MVPSPQAVASLQFGEKIDSELARQVSSLKATRKRHEDHIQAIKAVFKRIEAALQYDNWEHSAELLAAYQDLKADSPPTFSCALYLDFVSSFLHPSELLSIKNIGFLKSSSAEPADLELKVSEKPFDLPCVNIECHRGFTPKLLELLSVQAKCKLSGRETPLDTHSPR